MKRRDAMRWGVAGAAAVVAACGGGGGVTVAGEGTLRMALTDAPSCGYDNVWVTVDRVRVHQDGGASESGSGWKEIVLPSPRRIDLLELTNGVLEELGQTKLPAGTYNQVRLVLAENTPADPMANAVKPTGSAEVPLRTPSAQQSGLKLNTRFEVGANQTADLVLDFDACRSVVVAGGSGNYNLKPVLSVAERLNTGIQGYVSTTLSLSGTQVSAQQNGTVVRSTVPDTTGKFVLPFLPAGNYDIVITSTNRATAVVTSVPVTSAGTTAVNPSASPILPPAAGTVRTASGTAYVGAGTTEPATDAEVSASQSLTGGPTVLIARMPVDATAGTWSMSLPASAPVKATYATGMGLTFSADAAAAGKYRLAASAPGLTTVTANTDLTSANQVVDFHFAAP